MVVKGIGVDIEEIGRFRKLPFPRNKKFYERIFTSREIKYCLSKSDPYPHFAARFAAKEAIVKALGQSVYKSKYIEIRNDKRGAPLVNFQFPISNFQINSKFQILISLSHTKNYAVAVAFVYS